MKLSNSKSENLLKRDHKKARRGLCAIPFCRKARTKRDPLCPCCRNQYDKLTDPVRYTFNVTKNNAKRRGKEFTIDLEYFRQLCAETGYIYTKGRTANAMTLDRENSQKGYVPGNIRVISNSLNASKGNRDNQPTNDLPF